MGQLAGIASFGPLLLTDPEAWTRTVEVNLIGAFRTVRAALPAVIAARGYVAVTGVAGVLRTRARHVGVLRLEGGRRGHVQRAADRAHAHGVAVGTIRELDRHRHGAQAAAEHLAYRRLRAAVGPPFKRTYPVDRAARPASPTGSTGARSGSARRASYGSRTCCERRWRRARSSATSCARGALTIERLFAERVADRGRLETSMSERVAARLS